MWKLKKNIKESYKKSVDSLLDNESVNIEENIDKENLPNNNKVCPKCSEIIKAKAVVCRFCNYDLENDVFISRRS